MSHQLTEPETANLCYLESSKVESPMGALSELDVLTSDGKPLGSVVGVVIEAAARRVRYFAVQSFRGYRPHRYVFAADQLANLDPDRKALRLRVNPEVDQVRDVDPLALRHFSDDDLFAAMFASRAA